MFESEVCKSEFKQNNLFLIIHIQILLLERSLIFWYKSFEYFNNECCFEENLKILSKTENSGLEKVIYFNKYA